MCDTEKDRAEPNVPAVQWTIDPIHLRVGLDERYATSYADFGRGLQRRQVPRLSHTLNMQRAGTAAVAPPIGGENITGAPTREAAKAACERHASTTQVP